MKKVNILVALVLSCAFCIAVCGCANNEPPFNTGIKLENFVEQYNSLNRRGDTINMEDMFEFEDRETKTNKGDTAKLYQYDFRGDHMAEYTSSNKLDIWVNDEQNIIEIELDTDTFDGPTDDLIDLHNDFMDTSLKIMGASSDDELGELKSKAHDTKGGYTWGDLVISDSSSSTSLSFSIATRDVDVKE